MSEPTLFQPIGFQDRLAAWMQTQQPGLDIVSIVVEWIRKLVDDPYIDARRQTDIAPNLWWARIPGTYRDNSDVMCPYWIDEEIRHIRCDQIATLQRPN